MKRELTIRYIKIFVTEKLFPNDNDLIRNYIISRVAKETQEYISKMTFISADLCINSEYVNPEYDYGTKNNKL